MNEKYETVVGLEIHAHLKTESKMFCSCATSPKGKEYESGKKDDPNLRICPICTGQPGTLPVPNKKAIEDTILLGLALGSKISKHFNFERKNYYYPDLPKAYQITSATNPPVVGGGLEIELLPSHSTRDARSGQMSVSKYIELDHVHLEEDAGKLTHDKSGDFSLVDLNRAGTPLLEIITLPVLSSGAEAAEFMKNLQSILRALGISDADMEKGQMRCDANISVRKVGDKKLGSKVEVKNINSFKMVSQAIGYESARQIEALEGGEKVLQETRGWDANKGKTTAQRSKEFANDYRYFPEPDIPPIVTGKGTDFDSDVINDRLPELPKEKQSRFESEYGLLPHEAGILAANFELAEYYEKTIEKIPSAAVNSENKRRIGKQVAALIVNELLGKIGDISATSLKPTELAALIAKQEQGEVTAKIVKDVLGKAIATGKRPADIIADEGIEKVDEGAVESIVDKVLAENPAEVERYRSGDVKLLGFFVGQVMKESKGQADPAAVNKALKEKLG